jgi:hypothetical protein
MEILKPLVALSLSLLIGSAMAGVVNVPTIKPVVTIDIPDSWAPEETDKGIAVESADKVATVFFEIAASEKGMNALLDENIDWLVKDQGVNINTSSKKEQDFLVGGMKSSLMAYDATSKEFGPSKVGFIFTTVGKKLLVTTYWLTVKGFAKQEPVLDKILASVKPVK